MIVYNALPEFRPAEKTAVALGMFDGLHRGHLAVLRALSDEARASGCAACVFTFSTRRARPDAKTGAQLLSESMRDDLLAGLGVEYVFQPEFENFRDMEPRAFVENFLSGYLNAQALFCGSDFRFGRAAAGTAADLKAFMPADCRVEAVPLVRARGGVISSTRIRALIEDGDLPAANELLGRPFLFNFPVEYGRQLGRRLDWPTINQAFPAAFVRPLRGVYASFAQIDGVKLPSVTNVGVKPTVGSDHFLAETYIQGFYGDLYGQEIPVGLLEFIRGEETFETLDALKAQIGRDNAKAAERFKQYY